jgi:hypothetical protein
MEEKKVDYEKPVVRDYGELKDLTAKITAKGVTDVPIGTPGPTSAFS